MCWLKRESYRELQIVFFATFVLNLFEFFGCLKIEINNNYMFGVLNYDRNIIFLYFLLNSKFSLNFAIFQMKKMKTKICVNDEIFNQ